MTNTLWGGGASLAKELEAYTVGDDRELDSRLLPWDIVGTAGHALGLAAIGLLTADENNAVKGALKDAYVDAANGKLSVTLMDEDVHTAVERVLVDRLGELGKKVHAGRSRNDQVQVDLRLFAKDRLLTIMERLLDTASCLADFAKAHQDVVWPGYTHQRRAMPSTIGIWAAGFAESLLDDFSLLTTALKLIDRSPLGSAAGFGVPLPIDRELVSRSLGFATVQNNVTSVQATRGKLEVTILSALWSIAFDLGKLSWDIILFSSDEFGFLRLPPALATGSSIMPQKRNPDLFELTRGRAALLDGLVVQTMAIAGKLPSGYHRDLQLTKGPLIKGLDTALEMLTIMAWAIPQLTVDVRACSSAMTPDLFATDEVCRRVEAGVPFREAYRQVAAEIWTGKQPPTPKPEVILSGRAHQGGLGCLGLRSLFSQVRRHQNQVRAKTLAFASVVAILVGDGRSKDATGTAPPRTHRRPGGKQKHRHPRGLG